MLKTFNIVILLFFSFLFLTGCGSKNSEDFFKLFPIGVIEKRGDSTFVKISDNYSDGLKGLEEFSHVIVIYWFHENDTPEQRSILQLKPQYDERNPLTGVFACRAPVRPNLIGLSICKILSINDNIVHIDKIDAFNGSPVLDLKPHMPEEYIPDEILILPDWLKK